MWTFFLIYFKAIVEQIPDDYENVKIIKEYKKKLDTVHNSGISFSCRFLK